MSGLRVEGRTGADGTFAMGPFPPGEASMAAQAPGDRITWSSRERPEQANFALAAGEQKTGLKLTVTRKKGTIKGVVLAANGQPLAGASVQAGLERERGRAWRNDVDGGGRALTGPDGSFSIEELASGKFTLWAAHPGHPELEQNGIASGTSNVRLQLRKSASIAGVVVDGSGRPVRPYSLVVVPPGRPGDSEGMRIRQAMDFGGRPIHVDDARGAFQAEDLAPGSYDLVVTAGDGRTGRLSGSRWRRVRPRRACGYPSRTRSWSPGGCWSTRAGSPWPERGWRSARPGPPGRPAPTRNGAFTLDKVPALPMMGVSTRDRAAHARLRVPQPPRRPGGQGRPGDHPPPEARPRTGQPGPDGLSYTEREGKVVIGDVVADSVASRAGLRKGDTILEVDGKKLAGADISAVGGDASRSGQGGDPDGPVRRGQLPAR